MVQAELLSIFEPLRKTMNELTSKISELTSKISAQKFSNFRKFQKCQLNIFVSKTPMNNINSETCMRSRHWKKDIFGYFRNISGLSQISSGLFRFYPA